MKFQQHGQPIVHICQKEKDVECLASSLDTNGLIFSFKYYFCSDGNGGE